jgi:hypothetical protein
MTHLALFALLASQDSARIFVYAQRESAARSWRPILCDGVLVAKLKRGSFFAINVPPGRHALSIVKGVGTFVAAAAGNDSFVRLDAQIEIGRPPTLVMGKVDPAVARQEMRFVLYIEPKQVLSPSVSTSDPRTSLEPRLKPR